MPNNQDTGEDIYWPLPAVGLAFSEKNILPLDVFQEVKDTLNRADWGPGSGAMYHSMSGRWVINPELSDTVKIELAKACKKAYGRDDLHLAFIFAARYQKQGDVIPYLWEHIDENSSQYMMDICVELNGLDNWGVIVDGVEFEETENSAVFFHGLQQVHSRPPYPSQDDQDYVHVLFATFVDPAHWGWGLDYESEDYPKMLQKINDVKYDGNIRFYKAKGHFIRYNDRPAGNYECPPECGECGLFSEESILKKIKENIKINERKHG